VQLIKWYECYNLSDALRFDTQCNQSKKICVTTSHSYLFNYKWNWNYLYRTLYIL